MRTGAPADEDELAAGTLVRVTANSPDSVRRGLTPNPEPLNPKPRTPNPEPRTPSLYPRTPNPSSRASSL